MSSPTNDAIQHYPLSKLLLDMENPRFGILDNPKATQLDIVDHIVENFVIDDVLSSIAVNGFFPAEPLVVKKQAGQDVAVVAEGNRRLAACIIITGDARAARHSDLTKKYQKLWIDHGSKPIEPVPVILFESEEEQSALLPYLGVRHIASSQPWDSYAKAAWVANVIEKKQLKIEDVALMIGDQHRTVARLLEGFYFINQLINKGYFVPENSQRKGRGSVSTYPFSWVYTFLGYKAAREFLEIDGNEPAPEPIEDSNLPKAALVVSSLFGDRSKGKRAAVDDSRQLSDLAAAFLDQEKLALLEVGKSIDEINVLVQPIDQKLRQGLAEIRNIQSGILTALVEQNLPAKTAASHKDSAERARKSAEEIEKRLKELSAG